MSLPGLFQFVGEIGHFPKFLFNAQKLVIFSHPVRPGSGARLNLPYDSIISLNRLNSLELTQDYSVLVIPNLPGLYIPCDPESDLEFFYLTSRPPQIF